MWDKYRSVFVLENNQCYYALTEMHSRHQRTAAYIGGCIRSTTAGAGSSCGRRGQWLRWQFKGLLYQCHSFGTAQVTQLGRVKQVAKLLCCEAISLAHYLSNNQNKIFASKANSETYCTNVLEFLFFGYLVRIRSNEQTSYTQWNNLCAKIASKL